MYTGHQRNLGINRQGNGSGNNHNHHQSGNGKNRSIGNNGGCGNNTSRYTGNTKLNTSNNGNHPSGSSSGNSSISSNTSNNGINQSPTSSVSGPNVKSKGHSDSNWTQYCQEWNQYIFKGRQHGREVNNHNTTTPHNPNSSNNGLSDGANISQNTGIRSGMVPGSDKRNGSIVSSVQGSVKAEITGVTLKENYQPVEGEKKINPATDCDQNAMVKPFISYSNSNRYNSRGNWSNRGRGGGKGRGYNNSTNRGGGNRGIIQYPNGYYTTPMPSAPGLGLPVDTFGGYNFISVAAAPFQLAPYVCCEPECQLCPPAQTCYSTANGLMPQYYSLPAAFQYVPVSIGAPEGLQTAEVAPASGPPLPPTLEPNFEFVN